jgi:selenocysteine lyase/cysteine desulfurase
VRLRAPGCSILAPMASSSPPAPLPNQRALFDVPRDVAYLNCAYMSPLMKPVVAACSEGLALKAQPWTISPPDFFRPPERARALFGRLVNGDSEGVALIPAASYGSSLAARTLPVERGQSIVVLKDQFPSNVYPWRARAAEVGARMRWVELEGAADPTGAVLEALTADTAVAALPQVHWTHGARLDLSRIGARCRELGAALVVDATQSLGALRFDVATIQPDYLVAAAYKWLLGPYSTGFAWIAPRWRDAEPLEHTWLARAGSDNFARLIDYTDELEPGARRFDVGERSNFALLPGVIRALEQILDWGVPAIEATLAGKTAALAEQLGELGFTCPEEPWRAPHYLTARAPARPASDLLARLAARQIYVSQRGESLRITPHLYNDEHDAARLVEAVREAVSGC